MAEETNSLLQPDPGVIIPRDSSQEIGVTGLKVVNKRIIQEQVEAFRYPRFVKTVAEMRNNPTVGSAMNVYRMMMARIPWKVVPPPGASDVEKARAVAVDQMRDDMDHSWSSFIDSVIPYLEYGFAINEIVPRRRLRRNGSKYNDGIVGIESLPTRGQETISGWKFKEGTNKLEYIEQSTAYIENASLLLGKAKNGKIDIPIDRVILFSASATQGNPEGNSIYKNIYLAFKQLSLLQDQELVGIAKDIQGILKIELPVRYFSDKASDQEKQTLAKFQTIIDNYNAGTQHRLLVPANYDIDTKLPQFKYELLESKGSAKYNVEDIIKRVQGDILSALNVDVLKMGSDGTGSFSLAESKSSILTLAIDYRMSEIRDALNTQLMRRIYLLNGWDQSRMATFEYEDIEEVDLEVFGTLIQKLLSVSAVEIDRPFMNWVRSKIGVELKKDDDSVDIDNLSANIANTSSRSSDGMKVGTNGNGTSKDPFNNNNKVNNESGK